MSAISYQEQLTEKVARLRHLLMPYYTGGIDVYPSAPQHFRLRAEFRIWHDGTRCSYAMMQPGCRPHPDNVVHMRQFPAASRRINELMSALLDAIHAQDVLRERLYQVEFLTTLHGDDLITLIYHRKLDEAWQSAARALESILHTAIIGRSRKQKCVLSRDYVHEVFTVQGHPYHYRQYEGSFTQPNGMICQQMLQWVCTHNHRPEEDLLELYCGNGNFTLPLARQYRRVLATEVSKVGVKAVRDNIALNHIDNIAVARLSAEELTQAWRGSRTFNRLQQDGICLDAYHFTSVFVDPPRAGIDDATLSLLGQFPHITYVSCNPETLLANLQVLCLQHRIMAVALFDQFPFTHHIECGVILDAS